MKTHFLLPFPVNYVGECVRTVPFTSPDYARLVGGTCERVNFEMLQEKAVLTQLHTGRKEQTGFDSLENCIWTILGDVKDVIGSRLDRRTCTLS